MTEQDHSSSYENKILEVLSRSGTALANVNPGLSFLFLLSTIVPGFAFAMLWKKQGGQYRRSYSTITDLDYKQNLKEIGQAFVAANLRGFDRRQDILEARTSIEKYLTKDIREFIIKTKFGASLTSNKLLLIPLDGGKTLAEVYYKDAASENQLNNINEAAQLIYERLQSRLIQIYKVLSSEDENYPDFREIHGEQRLFRQIFRDMKTWFGEDFHTVNIFSFNPLDRMLYHLETSHLKIDPDAVKKYKPTPEILQPSIFSFISENIKKTIWPKDIDPQILEEILYDLSDKKRWRAKALKDDAKALKAILTMMPQEPGTGIAGETALTRIPQLGLDTADKRWKTEAEEYRETFFAAMLSVEQMFGIGSSRNRMAAVPLMESGQLWGVLFFVQRDPYTSERLLELWERAHHISSVLALSRSFQFQNAVIKSARDYPKKDIAQLALSNIHLALNAILAVHWQLHPRTEGGLDQVEYWQFDHKTKRFGYGDREMGKQGYFKSEKIRSRVLTRIDKGKIEIVKVSYDSDEVETGLPKNFPFTYQALVRSAVMIPVPPKDLLTVYTDEDAETLRAFLSHYEDRFSCLWDIQGIRGSVRTPKEFITQSKSMRSLLEAIDNAALTNVSILLRGERGTGKELIASRIHHKSTRAGQPFRAVDLTRFTKEMIAEELFGHVKSSHSTAFTDKIGEVEKADGGTLFLDEIGNLAKDVQGVLLRVIQEGEVRPIGGDTKPVDVRFIAATNRDLEKMIEEEGFLPDLYDRFTLVLRIPPLREHPEDIPLLARYFAHKHHIRISAETLAILWNYDWPGNVRKLENLIEAFGIFFRNSVITPEKIKSPIIGSQLPADLPIGKGAIQARNVKDYVGIKDASDDGCLGWALFSHSTYEVDEDPSEDWTAMIVAAFRRLKAEGFEVKSYCSVGCGAALDTIIAMNTWECQRIRLSDTNGEVLPVAQENVYLNTPIPVQIDLNEGPFFDGFDQQRFDLIYENLPNLPWEEKEDLQGRHLATYHMANKNASAMAEKYLLTTHEQFLNQARRYLEPNGLVVCCIGARVPWNAVVELFNSEGYEPTLIHYGIKKQQQPEEVTTGYARAEERYLGPFTFLDLKQVRELIEGRQLPSDTFDPHQLRAKVESEDLKSARLNAKASHEAFEGGMVIGHGVYVVAGRLK